MSERELAKAYTVYLSLSAKGRSLNVSGGKTRETSTPMSKLQPVKLRERRKGEGCILLSQRVYIT